MAQGIKALRKVQFGPEAVAGGSTDPVTTVWRGTASLVDNRETTFPTEDIGILGGTTRSYVAKSGGELTLDGEATFEQAPYIFQSGIYSTTPTTDTGSGLIWTWTVQNASTDLIATTDLQTYGFEVGDNNEAETMRYGFTKDFNITGAASEALMVSATVEGREITGGASFTSSISIPTVETILFGKAKMYIDTASDTIGTTLVSNTLLGADLTMTTGWQSVFTADGRIDLSFIKRVADEIKLSITYEHNGTATTEKAAWRNQTERAIRLKFEGNALTSAGTYTYKTFIIDLWGKYESFDALGDADGNDTVVATFRAAYSSTAANKARFIVVNELTTLP